jgi:hypothetical protein
MFYVRRHDMIHCFIVLKPVEIFVGNGFCILIFDVLDLYSVLRHKIRIHNVVLLSGASN